MVERSPSPMPHISEDLLPETLPSTTYRVDSGHGKMYVTVCREPDKNGKICKICMVLVKVSSSIPSSVANGGDEEKLHAIIITTACNRAEAEVVGKLASAALSAGVPAIELVALLVGVDCGHPYIPAAGKMLGGTTIKSVADAVGRVILHDITVYGGG